MRFFLVVSLSALAIAFAQDFFESDAFTDDDSPLFSDNLDATSNLDLIDPFLLSSAKSDPEQELSSCLSENSDLLSRRSMERMRARGGKLSCSTSDQPFLFKGSDTSDPGNLDPLEQARRGFERLLETSPQDSVAPAVKMLINEDKCRPGFPYNLCCRFRDSITMGLLGEFELTNYLVCIASLLLYRL